MTGAGRFACSGVNTYASTLMPGRELKTSFSRRYPANCARFDRHRTEGWAFRGEPANELGQFQTQTLLPRFRFGASARPKAELARSVGVEAQRVSHGIELAIGESGDAGQRANVGEEAGACAFAASGSARAAAIAAVSCASSRRDSFLMGSALGQRKRHERAAGRDQQVLPSIDHVRRPGRRTECHTELVVPERLTRPRLEGDDVSIAVPRKDQTGGGRQHARPRCRRVAELPFALGRHRIDCAQRPPVFLIARPNRAAAHVLNADLELLIEGEIGRARLAGGHEKQLAATDRRTAT